jgi:signal transduction histidine kinase
MTAATIAHAHRRGRDRAVLAVAVALVLLTSGLVLFTVVQAERDGVRALERLQQAQVQQLARSMNTRVETTFGSAAGTLGNLQLTGEVRSASDRAQLDRLGAFLPDDARTGFYIVDRDGRLANGVLLRDPAAIGSPVERPGLTDVLQGGEGAVLDVAPGITTALPTIAYAFPITKDGAVVGGLVSELDVSPQSSFNAEVAQLKTGRTGDFTFVDTAGVVVASSDLGLLGKPLADPLVKDSRGFHRGEGRIAVVEPVPAAAWRGVFRQSAEEFDGALTGPLRTALLLIVVAGALAAGVGVALLARRLRAAREEQRRLQEMSAVREEFISIVSHEVRTPVAGLLGFLQTTLDHWDGMDDHDRRRSLGRALSSARRLHSLTRDVLDTSSMESGALAYSFSLHDLRDEVGSAVVAAQDLHPDRVLRLVIPDRPVHVRCDPERLQQVLTNLLDNAMKSAPASAIDVTLTVDGDHGEVAVSDDGPGMSESELTRVFEKFVRGRTSAHAGTGLGLYISMQVVDAHGGTITASSEEGHGATVAFRLPLVDAPEPAAI